MKNKVVAALLAFFVGIFGVHRFYLGQTGKGIAYLLFFWSGIPALIGLIDAILFLAMDQDEFDYKYNWKYMDSGYQGLSSDFERRRYEEDRRMQKRDTRVRERQFEREYRKKNTNIPQRAKPNPYKEQGIQKFKDYDFDGAIEDFNKALEVNPNDIAVHFNLACAYSITENKDASFNHLDKAVKHGFNKFDKIQTHDALAYLRIQPEYTDFEKNNFRLSQNNMEFEEKSKESSDLLDQLKNLAELREKGLLTEEEFNSQKRRLLG